MESKVCQLFVFVCENDVKMSTVTSAIQVTHSQLSKKTIDLVSPPFISAKVCDSRV